MAEPRVKVGVKMEVVDFFFPKEPLIIESGGFDDVDYYGRLASVADVYRIQINGARNSRGVVIPARNPLPILEEFIQSNVEKYALIYGTKDLMSAGLMIGSDINGMHMKMIESFASPGNAQATIDYKGFDNPLINTGFLARSMFYSINGNGRYY